ncbi:hypothetical protein K488DRAFT_68359 [Vararia minispora EC-137]|uniref:Uncharacterized protein n=1 Tax=Vararia minispora EC-137 TaxID=1314806 RepID=A0ACB8QUC9_9AGAM|nr:hypothetical protein K488DRAFT_68359 [Vararia minispora EC-137]
MLDGRLAGRRWLGDQMKKDWEQKVQRIREREALRFDEEAARLKRGGRKSKFRRIVGQSSRQRRKSFVVVTRYTPNSQNFADFVFFFEIQLDDQPVFNFKSGPQAIFALYQYGGPQTIDWVMFAASILPVVVSRGLMYLANIAAAECWGYDVLAPVGKQRFHEIVEEIN